MAPWQLEAGRTSLPYDQQLPGIVNNDGPGAHGMRGYEWHECMINVAAHQGQLVGQAAVEGETGGGKSRNGLGIADWQRDPGQGQALEFNNCNQALDGATQRLRVAR